MSRRVSVLLGSVCLALLMCATPLHAQSITGNVKNAATNANLQNVLVSAYLSTTGALVTSTLTDASGNYTLTTGIVGGSSYFLGATNSQGFVNLAYPNAPCFLSCAPTGPNPVAGSTAVTAPMAGVNFAMPLGGTFTGTLRRASDNSVIAGTQVRVHLQSGSQITTTAASNGSGVYTTPVLPPGTYYASTFSSAQFVGRVYNGPNGDDCLSCPASVGMPIVVTTAGSNPAAVDFTLTAAGSISGNVGVAGLNVQLFGPNASSGSSLTSINSSASPVGSFSLTGLPAGTYYLKVLGNASLSPRLYHTGGTNNGIDCFNCDPSTGTPIVVGLGAAVTNINMILPTGGTISGSVRDINSSALLANINVTLLAPNGNTVSSVTTGGLGTFSFGGLAPGGYYLRTQPTATGNYISEAWAGPGRHQVCLGCTVSNVGAPVFVTAGGTTGNIDFVLTPGASISGTVSGPSGAIVAANAVSASDVNGLTIGTFPTTAGGAYKVVGLVPGKYYVRTSTSLGLIDEVYNDIQCVGCSSTGGTPIDVTAAAETPNINFALAAGARVSGRVTAPGGIPLSFVGISIFNGNNQSVGGFLSTDNAGNYLTTQGMTSGTYYLATSAFSSFQNEIYNGIPCVNCSSVANTGTAVALTAGATTPNIDFELAAGGRISGQVTDSVGTPLAYVSVQAFVATASGSKLNIASATTTATGNYAIGGLPPGTYYVRTSNSSGFVDRVYNTGACLNCDVGVGTPVNLTVGSPNAGGINFSLDAAGSISGTVRDAISLTGLGNVLVNVYASTGGPSLMSVRTTITGSYVLRGLPAGTYRVGTTQISTFGGGEYINQVYHATTPINCMTCDVTQGSAVVVAGTGNTSGIDLNLTKGAVLTGTVMDAATNAGIGGVSLQLSFINPVTGTVSSLTGTLSILATDANGNYRITGLLDGNYLLRTSNTLGYVDEVHNNIECLGCSVSGGTPIAITSSGATVNFSLTKGGRIAGTVTDGANPISGVLVQIFRNTSQVATLTTNANGQYLSSGLPPSTASQKYYVRTSNSLGYIDELYNNIQCSSCTIQTGTAIEVTGSATTSGIDFSLATGGSITGTVTAFDTGANLQGVSVQAYNLDTGAFVVSTSTNSSGVYTLKGLDPGTPTSPTRYAVRTSNTLGYIDRLYNGIDCIGCAVTGGTPITVATGVTTSGINFVLTAGGRISGTVTNGSTGIANVTVQIYSSTGVFVSSATTGSNGAYASSGLTAGDYYVRTSGSQGFINELHLDIPCSNCTVTSGSKVPVTLGATQTINFVLASGGSITGTVKDGATNALLSGVTVTAYTQFGSFVTSTSTNTSGTFTLSGLASGDYVVRTTNSLGYIDEQFDDQPCVSCNAASGTPVRVDAPSATSNVVFNLLKGGSVAGRVTDAASGIGISGISVQLYTANNLFVVSATTDSQGNYITKTGVRAGTYYARTSNTLGYINVIHPSSTCLSCSVTVGTPFAVGDGQAVTGIDFSLTQGGRITGTIRNQANQPLQGINVTIFLKDGFSVGGGTTNALGVFSSPGLPDGDYYARTNNSQGYINRLFDAKDCVRCAVGSGTPIHVDQGQTTSNINFTLTLGARIGGTVTDAATGDPLPGVSVTVFDSAGFAVGGSTPANSSGTYLTTVGLTPGRYYVRTSNQLGYVNKLYNGFGCLACSALTGTPIDITGTTSNLSINFALEMGGRISGSVTGAGAPLQDAFVGVFSSGGTFLTSASAGTGGQYVTGEGLPTGEYFLVTQNRSGFIEELFDGKPCASILSNAVLTGCAVTKGTPVPVTAGQTTTNRNFDLAAGGRIKGRVTDSVSGDPVPNLQINVYNSAGTWVSFAFTDGLGNYLTSSGLPPGQYFVLTQSFNKLNPYVNKLYANVTCPGCDPTSGTPVTVTGTATTSGIDLTVDRGEIVSGTVVESGTLTPISGATVRIFNSAGVAVSRVTTDDAGTHSSVSGLPAGTYFARTLNGLGYVDILFDQTQPTILNGGVCLACDVTDGTPIVVDGTGETSGINFRLPAGGRIIGSVTTTSGGAVAGATVRFFNTSGTVVGEVFTNGVGTYTSPGLPAGNYFVRTINFAKLIDEVYPNVPCAPCVPSQGTAVTVTTGNTTPNINFVLDGGGLVSGTVIDQTTGAPIPGVTVAVYRASDGVLVATTDPTDANGYYRVSLPIGQYQLEPNPIAGFKPVVVPGLRGPAARSTVNVDTGTETTGVGFALISCPAVTVNPATLPLAAKGQLYNTTLTASGGTGPYTFTISDGYPNTGLALATSGLLAGAPVFAGTGNFTVAVIDQNSCGGARIFALTACSFSLSTNSLSTTANAGSGSVNLLPNAADCPWLAIANDSWITVTSAASGTGTGTVTFSFGFNATGAARSGTITIGGQVFTITQAPPTSSPAFGVVDTPADGVTGIAGSLAVTGWALDDIEVKRVTISRDGLPGEPASEIYIGDATFVEGARPDVAAVNPGVPFNTRAGWGYLLLTNMLPNQGNGTFRLHIDAIDAEGSTRRIGSRTFVGDNANSIRPFGAIDTPLQGGVVSGTSYVNFGWALTPNPKSIPTDGSTITVFVDGAPAGNPVYNNFRADVAGLFPGLANTSGAIGYKYFDTTAWTNGVHTIAWVVSDSAGEAEGIGSRYFTVNNILASQRFAPTLASMRASVQASAAKAGPVVSAHVGFDRTQPALELRPDAFGNRFAAVGQLGRLELRFGQACGAVTVSQVVDGERQRQPVGSSVNRGTFSWMPGPAFLGTYQLEFTVPSCDGGATKIPVTVSVVPGR